MTDMAARRFSSLSNGESASCIFRKCFEITARTAADGTFVDSCWWKYNLEKKCSASPLVAFAYMFIVCVHCSGTQHTGHWPWPRAAAGWRAARARWRRAGGARRARASPLVACRDARVGAARPAGASRLRGSRRCSGTRLVLTANQIKILKCQEL